MFHRSLLALVSVALLSACAAPVYNYQAQSMAISEPPIGTVNTATVGDVMLRQGKYKEHDAIFVNSQANAGWAYTLYPGYYLKQGEKDGAEFFYPGGGDEAGRIEKSWIADPWKSVMTKKDSDDLCMVTVLNAYACSSGQQFERRKKPVVSQDSFQQTLIYSGRVGNKINIGYREFSNSMARPAFNNNVEYDLSDSSVIAYKGAQLEIVEATNQFIKYKVLRNFNEASN